MRKELQAIVDALAPLNVMGTPIVGLDTKLQRAVLDAQSALSKPDPKPRLGQALLLRRKHGETELEWRGRIIKAGSEADTPPEDAAYCIGCGTYPKGPYTCATCVEADNHEGVPQHISDWPQGIYA